MGRRICCKRRKRSRSGHGSGGGTKLQAAVARRSGRLASRQPIPRRAGGSSGGLSRGDWILPRQAIPERWETPAVVRRAVAEAAGRIVSGRDAERRDSLDAARAMISMDRENIRQSARGLPRQPAWRRRARARSAADRWTIIPVQRSFESGWGGIRTPVGLSPKAVFKTAAELPEGQDAIGVTESGPVDLAFCLALLARERPDLAAVVEAWDRLPAAIRAGIIAMVEAARG
jgi:hypothetical protein